MGLPQYSQHIRMFPNRRRGKSTRSLRRRKRSLTDMHRAAIQLAYILGIAGYVYTMRRWTLADNSLFWPAPRQTTRY